MTFSSGTYPGAITLSNSAIESFLKWKQIGLDTIRQGQRIVWDLCNEFLLRRMTCSVPCSSHCVKIRIVFLCPVLAYRERLRHLL